jgi:SAM-dependent methyltransferase
MARWGFEPAVLPTRSSVRVETSSSTFPRVTIQTSDGRWIRLHSERQPLDEARNWLTQSVPDAFKGQVICLIGAGYGYALDVLRTQASARTRILLLEPEPACLAHCLARADWTELIRTGRLMVLQGPDYQGRANAWKIVDAGAEDPLIAVHPVIGQIYPEASQSAAQVIGQAVAGARANEEARQRFAGPYLLNTLRNLQVLARARDTRTLFDRFAGVSAIVAGAGPSLNQNLADLVAIRGWRERSVVVAVDTALKPMLAAGVQPHYVVAVDPGDANARTLTDLPALPGTSLVAEASVHPSCFDAFDDRTFLFKVSDTHHPWPWLNHQGIDVARLRAFGSVLTTAYDFALRLGCNPIVFIGSDLAYTNGQPYCRNTVYEQDWAAAVARGATIQNVWQWQLPKDRLVTAQDLYGESVQTSTTLVAFRDWLVADTAGQASRTFLNATAAGILAGPSIEQRTVGELCLGVTAGETRTATDPLTPRLGDGVPLFDAARKAVLSALTPLPAPFPEWLEFARGRTTVTELLSTVAESTTHGGGSDDLDDALATRERFLLDEVSGGLVAASSPAGTSPSDAVHWRTGSASDWCLGPTPAIVVSAQVSAAFHSAPGLHITARRLEHLASLGLPLHGRNVLEVGAGIGDLTQFFADRGCRVHTTDVRPLNIGALRQRFARHPLVTVDTLDLDPPPEAPLTFFDIVFCYGMLNHVSNPAAALEFLARGCLDLLLIELNTGSGAEEAINARTEDSTHPGASFTGRGCRPSRAWVFAQLRGLFSHVYVPTTQPCHYEYPVNWSIAPVFPRRAIFVASRTPIDSPLLAPELLERQSRH